VTHDPYTVCPECGKTYHVCDGHNCEYGTYVPPVDYTRVEVEDSEGNDVEIRVDHA